MTWWSAIFATVVVIFPLLYRTARGAFEAFDGTLGYAGQTLGLSNTFIFWRIRMPYCRQGILAGTVLAFARALGEYGAISMIAGYTPGHTEVLALFPNMTVYQNIRCGVPDRREADAKTAEMIQWMELFGLAKKKPYQLSGGEQQRTALGRILVNEPELLLLDEPFAALDSHLRFSLERRLREIMRSFGKPVLLVSHDRDEVFRLAKRIAVMRNGSLEAMGEKHEVFRTPVTVNSARLTGCKNISAIRWLDDTHIISPDWGIQLSVPECGRKAAYAGVRMHDIHPGTGENTIECQVIDEIENPFSYTIMLKPAREYAREPMGMELGKEEWRRYRAKCLSVYIPSGVILLLKE